jgi:hypothetical protein
MSNDFFLSKFDGISMCDSSTSTSTSTSTYQNQSDGQISPAQPGAGVGMPMESDASNHSTLFNVNVNDVLADELDISTLDSVVERGMLKHCETS